MKRDVLTGAVALSDDKARELLDRVHAAAVAGSVAAFDLDSTLLDNSPRQARIMREYGAAAGETALTTVVADHWDGWDFCIPMRNVGLDAAAIEEHSEPFKDFWRERFFTGEYCLSDRPIAGAARFVSAVAANGARVCYVTGRHEPMRDGSATSLASHGFPPPDGDGVLLIMKPDLVETDDDYKLRIYATLRELGRVVAAFDNEPAHINGYGAAFPEALSIHLATDHSMRDIRVAEHLPSIADFSSWLG